MSGERLTLKNEFLKRGASVQSQPAAKKRESIVHFKHLVKYIRPECQL